MRAFWRSQKVEKKPCGGCIDPKDHPFRPAILNEKREGPAPERYEPRWRKEAHAEK